MSSVVGVCRNIIEQNGVT